MRTARPHRFLRTIGHLLLVAPLVLSLGAGSATAQDDDIEDFFGGNEYDDDLFGDDDEPVVDEFAEPEEIVEAEVSRVQHWVFNVPIDLAVLRPIALTDTAVGLFFYAGAAQLQILGAFGSAVVDYVDDGEWYVDQGNTDQAWQQLVNDPFEYLAFRPLGELTSD